MEEINDNEATIVRGIIGDERQYTRYVIKLIFNIGELAITSCISALRVFFQHVQRLGDRKVILLL